jgi:hypothetical protein
MAPADLPPGGTIQVTATSHADRTKSSSASVTVSSDVAVSVSPGSSAVELGSTQSFHAAISSNGRPDSTIHWGLSGSACPAACGTIDANGNYTAPQILPGAAIVNLTATSAADPSRQSTASITITSNFRLQIAAPPSLAPGVTSAIVATMTPVAGSQPNTNLSWALSGAGCSGSACGTITVTTTQAAGASPISDTANYIAPSCAPQPDTVFVTVTPLADASKKVQATITILGGTGISLSPITQTIAANQRFTLSASVSGLTSATLNWSVNGIAGGNATFGQICVTGSSPCQVVTSSAASQMDYLAPGAIPSPNPFSIVATSAGNSSLTASAQVTVINHILVSVQPPSVTLPPMGVQGFVPAVLGSTNQSVTWQIQGAGCGAAGACGTVDSAGTYTAPQAAPAPSNLQVLAISQADSSQIGVANVIISGGPNILSLHPASLYAGAADGFTLLVTGSGFVPSNPGPGSTLLIGGTPRFTTCDSANSCTVPVSSADVTQAGNVAIQILNPDATTSNTVQLVLVSPNSSEDVITLTSSAPGATAKDITVVQPTTAGLDSDSSNLDVEVAAIGTYVTSSNTCYLAGNPIPLARPANGTTAADICVFSQAGFDTSMSYTISGPGDISVVSKQPAGLGIIHLTLQIPATAAPGARSLFIQNANLDRTAASGVLEIQ